MNEYLVEREDEASMRGSSSSSVAGCSIMQPLILTSNASLHIGHIHRDDTSPMYTDNADLTIRHGPYKQHRIQRMPGKVTNHSFRPVAKGL